MGSPLFGWLTEPGEPVLYPIGSPIQTDPNSPMQPVNPTGFRGTIWSV